MKTTFARKKMIFLIRLLVIVTTAYFILFTPSSNQMQFWGYIFIGVYVSTNCLVALLPNRLFYQDKLFYTLILCDSIMLPAGIYLSGYVGSDLYLMYFFIISLTTMGARFEYLMLNTIIFSIIYGSILYQNGMLAGLSAVSYGLRIPFIISITTFYGFLVTTRIKDKEDKIREIQERYEQIVQATDVLICIVDDRARLIFANQKFVTMYSRVEDNKILGKFFSDFHSPGDSKDTIDYIHAVYQTNKQVQYEAYDPSNQRWFSNTLSPVRNPNDRNVYAVSIISKDITERIKREKQLNDTIILLRRTRDQLIQKDKMAALGRMASGIAHEIRNPLEIISMGMDYIDYNIPNDNVMLRQSIEKIYNAITRANNIIRDVLSFSRKSIVKISNIPLIPLLDNTLSLTKHNLRKTGITLKREYASETMEVAADHNMLQQVFLNLINNAVDAMQNRAEKQLTIRVYKQKVYQIDYKAGRRRSDFFKIGDEIVVVEISDTGRGIPKSELPKIFEPFFTTKSTSGGTGLGLSLCHMIIDRLKGVIDVESSLEKGSTFSVKILPATKKPKIRTGIENAAQMENRLN